MRFWTVVTAGLLVLASAGAGAGAATTATEAPSTDQIVARVNQTDITLDTFQSRLKTLEQERGPIPAEQRGQLLHALVREEVLTQAAMTDHLDEDAAVKAKLEVARRQVLIEELLRRKAATLPRMTDEDLRKVYEENKPLFTKETVRVSHVMVKTEAEAEAIRKELEAGKDFAELAKSKSQDAGSAEKGGDLGELSHGQTVPEFEEAAFALKDGELSGIVKTEYGYHIVKGGPHATTTQSFDEVKGQLRATQQQQRERNGVMAYIDELEQQAKIEVFENRLK
jgi:peptidyl-prolyl cis-trans isomerase C